MAAYVGLLALAGFFVYIGVAAIHDRGEPVIWGTFTVERREPGRGIEHVSGRWRSDDGRVVERDVALDGSAGAGDEVRAYLRPGSLLGGTTIVHDGRWDWVDFVAGPVFFLLSLGFLWAILWIWDDLTAIRRRWGLSRR
ncbi:hypothetical protein ASF23_15175 [Curtobacterium sp. Leaf261]|nr:hypothetical protein ASF23_15175 [Curtobacterium sp. Leaf261]